MDTKNVIAAISLSAAVIILYSLFFAPSPNQQIIENNQKKNREAIRCTQYWTIWKNRGYIKKWGFKRK